MAVNPSSAMQVGLAKESTEGTYAAPTLGVPVTNGSPLAPNYAYVKDTSFRGTNAGNVAASLPTVNDATVTLEGWLYPGILGHLFLALYGTDTPSGSDPYEHVYTVPATQPASYSLTIDPGIADSNTDAVVGAHLSDLTISWQGVGSAPTFSATFMGQLDSSRKAAPTLTYPTDTALQASHASFEIASSANTLVEELSLTWTRSAQHIHTIGPAYQSFSAGMDLTGSMKLIFSDNTQADYVAAATQTQIKLLVDDSSNNRRLEVEASSVSWEQYTPEFKDVNNYVSLALPSVQALYNSTDSGVAQVTVESGDATY